MVPGSRIDELEGDGRRVVHNREDPSERGKREEWWEGREAGGCFSTSDGKKYEKEAREMKTD